MGSEPRRLAERRQQIGDRIATIRSRISELQQAQQTGSEQVSSRAQLTEAQHHAAVSDAAAQQALAASIDAFEQAAQAHDRLASHYQREADYGGRDPDGCRQRAAYQREAAASDRRRAEAARSLLSSRTGNRRGRA